LSQILALQECFIVEALLISNATAAMENVDLNEDVTAQVA